MDDLMKKLMTVECPFTWKLDEIPERQNAADIILKLQAEDVEDLQPWLCWCLNITISYLHYENKDFAKATQLLQEWDQFLKSTENSLVKTFKQSFQSIYYASRAVLASKSSTVAEVKEYIKGIALISELSDLNKSAIYAVKAVVFTLLGVNGMKSAVPFAEEALKLCPLEGEWHFLKGALLMRLRYSYRECMMPTSPEISHLQTFLNLTKSPRAAILLANVYLDKYRYMSCKMSKTQKNMYEAHSLVTEGKRLLLFALEKNDNRSVKIMIHCANGLFNLPYYNRDVKKAKEILKEVLKHCPLNAKVNKLAGDICLLEDEPLYEEALKYYEVAASKNLFIAELLRFDVNEKLGKNLDPEIFFSSLLTKYNDKNYQLRTLIKASQFYLFIRRDLIKALHYFLKILKFDPEHYFLKVTRIKLIEQWIQFFKIMCNETRIALEKNLHLGVNQEILKDAILKMKQHNPELMKMPIEYNLIQKLIMDKEEKEKRQISEMRHRGDGNEGVQISLGRGFVYKTK